MKKDLRPRDLKSIIKACRRGKPEAQEALYKAFYGYAMGVSLRYSHSKEQAEEIINDSFLKVFTHIHQNKQIDSFKSWLRRILINTAIDHFRRNEKHYNAKDIDEVFDQGIESNSMGRLSEQDLIKMIRLLPPAYQMTFNLYAIEGYKHQEIAKKLGVTTGTSKSNLAKARKHLKRMLQTVNQEKEENYG